MTGQWHEQRLEYFVLVKGFWSSRSRYESRELSELMIDANDRNAFDPSLYPLLPAVCVGMQSCGRQSMLLVPPPQLISLRRLQAIFSGCPPATLLKVLCLKRLLKWFSFYTSSARVWIKEQMDTSSCNQHLSRGVGQGGARFASYCKMAIKDLLFWDGFNAVVHYRQWPRGPGWFRFRCRLVP